MQLTTQEQSPVSVINTAAMMMTPASLQALVSFSELMAKSVVAVPNHLRGKPADCLAVAMQAAQWGMNPFAVAQKTHLVNGQLGYEAQLVNAVVQALGAIDGRFHYDYEGTGNALKCRVGAVPRGESEVVWNEWLSVADVQTKNSPLWKTNPKQQMGYLQVKNWSRAFVPGAILGVYTPDELETVPAAPREMGDVEQVARGPQRKSAGAAPAAPTDTIDVPASPAAAPSEAPLRPVEDKAEAKTPLQAPTPTTEGSISPNQAAYLRNKMKAAGVEEKQILARYELGTLDQMTGSQFDTVKAELLQVL